MSDYFPRSELSPVERSATRGPSAVTATTSATARQGRQPSARPNPAKEDSAGPLEGGIASSAEYAKVHARIADILAELRLQGGTITVEGAAEEIQSMIPAPSVLVPLPPASKDAVESSIRIARRIAEQASYAYAAQANMHPGTVELIISPGI